MIDSLISVIIPIYNSEQFLGQCLESILQQTYSNLEVICVDDGSTDGSLSICRQYREKDSRVYVIHKANEGVSCARNRGVNFAHGQFVFFIDADDFLDKNALKTLILQHNGEMSTLAALNYDRVSAEAEAAAYSCSIDIMEMPYKNLERKKVLDLVSVRRGWYIWGMLIPKALINKYQLKFPENIRNLEDAAWIGMTFCYVENIVFIEAELYHYRENPVSITSNCVNYSWQAEHWMKVYRTLVDYFRKIKINYSKRSYTRKMLRYCKNNFYAECFAGKISYHDAKEICMLSDDNMEQTKYSEYFVYKCYFTMGRIIKRSIKRR